MSFEHLQQRREGGVEYLVLNRPEVRNALNEHLIAELTTWADQAARDAGLRAVVLSGAGAAFCAGGDLTWMSKMAAYSHDENLRDATEAVRMFFALDRLPVPLIARIHGAAMGGGAGLAAIADIVVAETGARFGFPEVKIGLMPAIIAPFVVAKIGQSAARELFVTGRRFTAEHAKQIGLVHAVVPVDQLDRAVQEYVGEITNSGPEAVAAAKGLLHRIASSSIDDAMPFTAAAIAERRVSAEAQQRMAAFLKKGR